MNNDQELNSEDDVKFDTVLPGNIIDNVTVTGQLKRPSMITICLKNGEIITFEATMDIWRKGLTATIEGRRGIRLDSDDDGQTIESSTEKEKDADQDQ